MSDVMLLGVLRMPIDDYGDLTLIQFIDRAREAADRIEKDASELERLRATFRLTERFVNAKGRYHSQLAMCDLMEHFGKSCVRPESE